jgi:hypothetical protein
MKQEKITLNDCIEFAKNKGGKCLSVKYKNMGSLLIWECAHGHIHKASFTSVKNNIWCRKCKQNEQLKNCIEFAESKGGKCISKEYINRKTKLDWECEFGHIWKARFRGNKTTWCPHCNKNAKLVLQDCVNYAALYGGYCLSIEYISSRTKMIWQCKRGHVWYGKFGLMKCMEQWCEKCYRMDSTKYTWGDIELICDSVNVKFINCPENKEEKIYNTDNRDKEWKFECCCGRIFYPILSLIGNKERVSCGCIRSKAQIELFKNIQETSPDAINNCRSVIWPMEIDIYIPSLKLAIEYDGEYYHHSEWAIKKGSLEKMARKDQICKDLGITLIRIREKDYEANKEQTIVQLTNTIRSYITKAA